MDSRRGLQVLFVSFTKGPGGFPHVPTITAQAVTLVPVYGTTLVEHRVPVLRGDQKVFDGFATPEVSLDATSTTDPLDTFTKTLCVGYDNVTLTLHSTVGRLGRIVAPIIDPSGRPVKSLLHAIQGPPRVAASGESFPEVLFLLLEQLRIAAHGEGPTGEGLDDTELG